MSMISEQVNKLRTTANNLTIGHNMSISSAIELFREAADTIEALSAKLAAANMERSDRYYEMRKELVEQHNKAFELISKMPLEGNEVWHGYVGGVMHTLGHLIDRMDKPDRNNAGGWISDKGPKESGNYFITTDTVVMGEVDSDVAYWDGKSWNTFANVYAWKPIKFPEPYRP